MRKVNSRKKIKWEPNKKNIIEEITEENYSLLKDKNWNILSMCTSCNKYNTFVRSPSSRIHCCDSCFNNIECDPVRKYILY